mmetsp:Transcript_11680/g.22691  ORF Transcript_11680/g.22691 Transcript_11680/m.22691 type:complete len:110 (-) Transcript_11680:500-829(-)
MLSPFPILKTATSHKPTGHVPDPHPPPVKITLLSAPPHRVHIPMTRTISLRRQSPPCPLLQFRHSAFMAGVAPTPAKCPNQLPMATVITLITASIAMGRVPVNILSSFH